MKEIFEKIWQEIDGAKKILLTLHPKPDADSVGSCLAFAFALEQLGHEVTVIKGDSPLPEYLSGLPGYNKIVAKNIWEVASGNFDLFLVLDLSKLERLTDLGNFVLPPTWRVVCVDHHQGATLPAHASLINTTAPATAVLVYDLLKWRKVEFTHDMAANLIIGIHGDTGGFRYAGVDSALFSKVADLLKFVPDYPQLIFAMENNLTPEAIKFEALALAKIEVHKNLALIALSYEELAKVGLLEESHNGSFLASKLKSVISWNIGVVLTEAEPGIVRVSFRTRDATKYDLAKLAEALGGGGHKAAAGVTIRAPLLEAKKLVLAAVQNLHPELL